MSQKQQLSFIGYSGHAYVCIEIAQLLGHNLLGYYDILEVSNNPYNLQFLGHEEDFEKEESLLFVSIGDNKTRAQIYAKLSAIKADVFTSLQHPTAVVSKTVKIKKNTLISSGVSINALSVIETGCIINTGAIIEHECYIHEFAHIAPGAVLSGNVTVGARSFIGARAVVKQGVTIGKDVIVGAGAVVVNDIPDNYTVIGCPAKPLKK
ncbi:NeuD/PglB/VioB family sugar acetyltransferase [Lacinutrix undariae]